MMISKSKNTLKTTIDKDLRRGQQSIKMNLSFMISSLGRGVINHLLKKDKLIMHLSKSHRKGMKYSSITEI
jgi:hypothetical protein